MSIVNESLVLLELGLSASSTADELAIVRQAIIKAEAAVMTHLRYDPAQKSHTEYFPQQDYTPANAPAVWEVQGSSAVLRRRAEAATNELQLIHLPIRASTAIDVRIEYDGRFGTKSGAFAADSQKTEGVDFWAQYDSVDSDGYRVCRDGILRSVGRWPTEPGSVKVVYTAGYTAEELAGEDSVINAATIMDVVVEESLRRAKKVLTYWYKNSAVGHISGTVVTENLGDYSYSLSTSDKMTSNALAGGSITSESASKLSPFVNWGLNV